MPPPPPQPRMMPGTKSREVKFRSLAKSLESSAALYLGERKSQVIDPSKAAMVSSPGPNEKLSGTKRGSSDL